MTDSKNNTPGAVGRSPKRTALIAGAVTIALLLAGGGVAAIMAVNRSSVPRPTPVRVSQGAAAPSASASVAPTGSATWVTPPAQTLPATSPPESAGAKSDPNAPPAGPKAKRPSSGELDALGTGQWRLYGARVVATGVELKSGSSTDIQGIDMECEALAKSGSGYAYATVEIQYSASGPVSGKGGPWALFGTWVLTPNDGAKANQHYGQGIGGSLAGRSNVRPPSSSAKVTAAFSPIGAYRPKTQGVIRNGSFNGNGMFEGVLSLPSVPVPPASL